MATCVGIGFSQNQNKELAAKEAAIAAKNNLEQKLVNFAFVFCSIDYNPQTLLPLIQQHLDCTKIIGSSSAGILLSDSFKSQGIAIMAVHSDNIEIGSSLIDGLDQQDPHTAANTLARNCLNDFTAQQRQAFIFFADSRLSNMSQFLKGIQDILGNVFCIIGAGSCGDFKHEHAFQIHNNNVCEHGASGVVLGGHANVCVTSRHGFKPLGKPRIVDKVKDNVIKTIDGKKAFSIYEEYFSKDIDLADKAQLQRITTLYPLGFRIKGDDEYRLRHLMRVEADGSIVCQGDVPKGIEIHIMINSKNFAKQAVLSAAQEIQKNLAGTQPSVIIVFESVARLLLLGDDAFSGIQRIKEVFGSSVPVIGIYTHGEIAPLESTGRFKKPYLQNGSVTVMAIN